MPADPPVSAPAPRPQFPPAEVALSLLANGTSHRAQLATLELGEARDHATGSLLLASAVGVLTLLAGFALTLLAAALVWASPHREWWLAGMTVCYLAIAGGAAAALNRRLRTWQPLAETHHQLLEDCECLRHLLVRMER